GLTIAMLWTLLYVNPVFKYTEFTAQVLVPFFFDALLRFLDRPRLPHAIYLGLTLGVLGYAHPVAFIAGVMITLLGTLVRVLVRREDEPRPIERLRGLAVVLAGASL